MAVVVVVVIYLKVLVVVVVMVYQLELLDREVLVVEFLLLLLVDRCLQV